MMKLLRVAFVALFFMLFLASLNSAYCIDTGFETESMETNLKSTFLSNIVLEVFYTEPEKLLIDDFDVNSTGLIALGTSNSTAKRICVYDSDGIFKYGYKFNSSGDFVIEWDDEDINIYFDRSDVLASFDNTGECVGILKVKNTKKNSAYMYSLKFSDECIVGNNKYVITNDNRLLDSIIYARSKLLLVNSDERVILYDVSKKIFFSLIVWLLFLTLLLTYVMVLFVRMKKGRQRKTKRRQRTNGNGCREWGISKQEQER